MPSERDAVRDIRRRRSTSSGVSRTVTLMVLGLVALGLPGGRFGMCCPFMLV